MATLDELKIRYAIATFEADNLIAAVARETKCLVISNDSDFFLFDLPSGYISTTSLRVTK